MITLKNSALLLAGFIALSGARAFAADMNDAQISSIMMTANEGEVAAGKLAQTKAQNKDVKDFAAHMVKEHTKNEADGKALAAKLKVKPEPNATQASIKTDSDKKAEELKKLSGKEFDKGYIDSQITMHQTLLNELSSTLIPKASADMKTFLETTKTHVQAHLEQAQKIQTALNK